MRQLDFYEFAGILAPGTVLLFGISQIYPSLALRFDAEGLALGEFGIFVILAYVAGNLTQAIGNGVEWAWWGLFKGPPTEWIRTGRGGLVAVPQAEALPQALAVLLRLEMRDTVTSMSRSQWFTIAQQMRAAVSGAGRSRRLDVFTGSYGMFRGIASSLLVLTVLVASRYGLAQWGIALALLLATGLALIRMHRFGRHYATELLTQFLQLAAEKGSVARQPTSAVQTGGQDEL